MSDAESSGAESDPDTSTFQKRKKHKPPAGRKKVKVAVAKEAKKKGSKGEVRAEHSTKGLAQLEACTIGLVCARGSQLQPVSLAETHAKGSEYGRLPLDPARVEFVASQIKSLGVQSSASTPIIAMIDENVTEAQQKKLETDIAALARSDPSRFLTLDAAINLEVLDGATRLEATARVKEGEADETVWTVKLVSRALLDDAMYGGYYTALHGLDNPLATHKMWDAERLERYHLLVHQKQDGKGGLVPTKVEHPKIAVWTVSFGEDTHGYLKKLHRDWALAQAVVKFISVPSFRQGLHLSSIAKNVCKHGMGSFWASAIDATATVLLAMANNESTTFDFLSNTDLAHLDSNEPLSNVCTAHSPAVDPATGTFDASGIQYQDRDKAVTTQVLKYVQRIKASDEIGDEVANGVVALYERKDAQGKLLVLQAQGPGNWLQLLITPNDFKPGAPLARSLASLGSLFISELMSVLYKSVEIKQGNMWNSIGEALKMAHGNRTDAYTAQEYEPLFSFVYHNRSSVLAALLQLSQARSDQSLRIIACKDHHKYQPAELHHNYLVFNSIFHFIDLPELLPFSTSEPNAAAVAALRNPKVTGQDDISHYEGVGGKMRKRKDVEKEQEKQRAAEGGAEVVAKGEEVDGEDEVEKAGGLGGEGGTGAKGEGKKVDEKGKGKEVVASEEGEEEAEVRAVAAAEEDKADPSLNPLKRANNSNDDNSHFSTKRARLRSPSVASHISAPTADEISAAAAHLHSLELKTKEQEATFEKDRKRFKDETITHAALMAGWEREVKDREDQRKRWKEEDKQRAAAKVARSNHKATSTTITTLPTTTPALDKLKLQESTLNERLRILTNDRDETESNLRKLRSEEEVVKVSIEEQKAELAKGQKTKLELLVTTDRLKAEVAALRAAAESAQAAASPSRRRPAAPSVAPPARAPAAQATSPRRPLVDKRPNIAAVAGDGGDAAEIRSDQSLVGQAGRFRHEQDRQARLGKAWGKKKQTDWTIPEDDINDIFTQQG